MYEDARVSDVPIGRLSGWSSSQIVRHSWF